MCLKRIFFTLAIVTVIFATCENVELPSHYIEAFNPAKGGRPTLGSPRSTCWARGGICVHIYHCRSMSFDPSIAGCNRGFKVCCKVHEFPSPTAGIMRSTPDEIVVASSDLRELIQNSANAVATKNSNKLQSFL